MTDDSVSERVDDALDEMGTAASGSHADNLWASLRGWRNTAGVTLGFAVFLDLLVGVLGAVLWMQTSGIGGTIAAGVCGVIMLAGLVEKAGRRIR